MTDEKQHMTVYVFFIFNAIIDLSLHLKLHKMPDGTDYIVSSIAWAGFGFLFLSHKHAKTTISIYYHQTLGWLAVVVAVISLMQYKYPKNTLIALARGGCCTLAGTWLYQVCDFKSRYFICDITNHSILPYCRLHFYSIILSLLLINTQILDRMQPALVLLLMIVCKAMMSMCQCLIKWR